MKFQKLNLINKLHYLLLILFIFLLSGCTKREYPKPTNEFYVNDFADAYHPVIKNIIINEGERLYEDTKDIPNIGGAQIVFATFMIKDISEIAMYNRTDVFREWEIGKNDMGILVLMFFSTGEEDGTNYIYLEETQIEVGYRMEQYFPATKQGRILDDTIYSDTYLDLDMKFAFLYYEILKLVYEEVYFDYFGSFSYDLDIVDNSIKNYVFDTDNDFSLFAWLFLLFTGPSKWYMLIPIAFIIFGGTIKFTKNRGGGGSSGGYGIFRRR